MASKIVLEIETELSSTLTKDRLDVDTSVRHEAIQRLITHLELVKSGSLNGVVNVKVGAVPAKITGTFTGISTAADTITVNGVVFTCKDSGAAADEFNKGASVTAAAANLAAAINASVTAGVVDVISASSSLGVITFTSKQAGKVGNAIVLSESLGNFTLAGTVLAGGTQSTNKTYQFGLAPTFSY